MRANRKTSRGHPAESMEPPEDWEAPSERGEGAVLPVAVVGVWVAPGTAVGVRDSGDSRAETCRSL